VASRGRLVLADFELSKQSSLPGGAKKRIKRGDDAVEEVFSALLDAGPDGVASPALAASAASSSSRGPSPDSEEAQRFGTLGFMAPEVESTGVAVYASDMYSFGILLYCLHYDQDPDSIIAGDLHIPAQSDPELAHLIKRLTSMEPDQRPTAAQALLHPYFRRSYAERLEQDGEVVEQDRKLDAVRNMIQKAREDNRTNLERLSITRGSCTRDVLRYFREMDLQHMRYSLRVTFEGEAGVDEGGPLTEMFRIFFDEVMSPKFGLFHGPDTSKGGIKQELGVSASGGFGDGEASVGASSDSFDEEGGSSSSSMGTFDVARESVKAVLPAPLDLDMERLQNLRAFGRAMIKALYEGRRMGTQLCSAAFKFLTDSQPTIRDLQHFDPQNARSCEWTLATEGVQAFGLHFESVGAPELGEVTDANKVDFVKRKIHLNLIECRKVHLSAVKNGFIEALRALSPEAAPFMGLLSHTDWRIMLCGDQTVSGPQVVSCLKFTDFPRKSKVPQWLRELILSASEDHLRKFLVFLTGAPSLSPTTSSSGTLEINVRCQPKSEALPTAHTCFFQLDIPDYTAKETFQAKFVYAITHAQSFEVV
jgi:hypothetical protein